MQHAISLECDQHGGGERRQPVGAGEYRIAQGLLGQIDAAIAVVDLVDAVQGQMVVELADGDIGQHALIKQAAVDDPHRQRRAAHAVLRQGGISVLRTHGPLDEKTARRYRQAITGFLADAAQWGAIGAEFFRLGQIDLDDFHRQVRRQGHARRGLWFAAGFARRRGRRRHLLQLGRLAKQISHQRRQRFGLLTEVQALEQRQLERQFLDQGRQSRDLAA